MSPAPEQPVLYLVGGLPRHGKSTLASCLSVYTGLPWGDTSQVIYDALAEELGTTRAELQARDKSTVRQQLIDLGDRLVAQDPAYLVRRLVQSGIRIVAGVRAPEQILAVEAELGPVLTMWVEALDQHTSAAYRALDAVGEESLYVAPTVADNTDAAGVRALSHLTVLNTSMAQVDESARYIAARYPQS